MDCFAYGNDDGKEERKRMQVSHEVFASGHDYRVDVG